MALPEANVETREIYAPLLEIRPPSGVRPIDMALEHSNKYGRLPVWSIDLPNPKNDPDLIGRKRYVVASYTEFKAYGNRFAYEIILAFLATKLYVDVDMVRALNPELTDAVIAQMLAELDVAIQEEAALVFGDANAPAVAVTVLDSSTSRKLSKHLIYELFLTNNFHCGAFMRRVRDRMLHAYETAPGAGDKNSDHPYYVWDQAADPTKPKSGVKMRVRNFFADLKVYTHNRNFRVFGSRKAVEGSLPLSAEGAPFNWPTYDRCLLQRRMGDEPVFRCLEVDGSEPVSTSNANLGRYDLPPAGGRAASAAGVGGPGAGAAVAPAVSAIPADQLKACWDLVYPFDFLYEVLAPARPLPSLPPSSSQGDTGWRREFRFAFPGSRWTKPRCFGSADALRAAVLDELPEAIHVGPVVRVRTADGGIVEGSASAGGRTEPWQPTLTIDVDINEYSPFRPCCGSEGKACRVCWPIAGFAQDAITAFATELGLGTTLCFFSGNKGAHFWFVGAEERVAKVAGSEARRRMLDDFNSVVAPRYSSGEGDAEMGTGYHIPNRMARSGRWYVEEALGDDANKDRLADFIRGPMQLRTAFDTHSRLFGLESAILHVLWPRPDRDVTVSPTHKIKAPFCIHPKTARYCEWIPSSNVNPYALGGGESGPANNVAAVELALAFKGRMGAGRMAEL